MKDSALTAGVTGDFAPVTGTKCLVIGAKLPVDSVIIRREPDNHGVGREPGTPAVNQAERSVA
jgi:hypothetical protein